MNTMLEYKGYHATIEYDAEDELFVGEVFGITDSLNFHGSSINELKSTFSQCIDNYLELCKKVGKNPDKEFRGTFNVRIPPELHRKAALAAVKQKITLNQYVVKAISYSLEEQRDFNKTIIYIPYGTIQTNWENGMDYEPSVFYQSGSVITKKERVSYVGN